MKSWEELVEDLIQMGRLSTPEIIDAFKNVNRGDFMGDENKELACIDRAFRLPYGGQTISQPSTVAFMLEQLQPKVGEKVLDVGCGSGWTTTLLAHIVGDEGEVHGTEIVEELVDFGRANVRKYPYENWKIHQAEKGVLGLPSEEFDRILVSAEAKELPQELVEQLKEGGVMVLPVGSEVRRVEKRKGEIESKSFPGFAFVPLITDNEEIL